MLYDIFEPKIINYSVVVSKHVIVPFDKFEAIFQEVKNNPTYENMIEINDLGFDDEGNPIERGYSEFLKQCKDEGILS